ncbi:MAG: CBS domain-containing protein [Desulfonauticus sp.]|nr:CBS domain-containing protein [Desulfonauticus sp.]
MLLRKRVWDIMREDFPYVKEDVSLTTVIKTLNDYRNNKNEDINCVVVYSLDDKFLGIISMWNIINSLGPCLLKETALWDDEVNWDKAFTRACRICSQVGLTDIVQTDVPRVKPNDPLAKIMEIFLDYRRGRAIVEEGGKVIGLVLLSDLYKEVARDVENW